MSVTFEIPVNLVSEMNWRGHHMARYRRFKAQKKWISLAFAYERISLAFRAYHITLTRIKAPRQRDFDGDNLQSSFKAIRDEIADNLGIDDGSDRLQWEYRQEKGKKSGVRVEIEENA